MEGSPAPPPIGPEGPRAPQGSGTPRPEGPLQPPVQPGSSVGPDNLDPQALADRAKAAEATRGAIAGSSAFEERLTNESLSGLSDKPTTGADSSFLEALRENMSRHEGTMRALDPALRGEHSVSQITPEQRAQNEAKFAAAYQEWVTNILPEDRQALERSAREAIKGALGITDTADMSEETRRAHEATVDWFFGKIKN